MLKQSNPRKLSWARACATISVLMFVGFGTSATALEKTTVLDGITACNTWCEKHNPPGNGRNACMSQCRKYWYCNGKDALSYTLNCKYYGGRVPRR